jgi:L-lactate dehydrogenase complex protein LldF
MNLMGAAGRKKGRFKRLPLARGWTDWRDMPAPEGKTFHQLYAEQKGRPARPVSS